LWTSSRRAKRHDAKTEEPASDQHHEYHAIADVGKADDRSVETALSFIQDAWHRNTFVSALNWPATWTILGVPMELRHSSWKMGQRPLNRRGNWPDPLVFAESR
jgi:hypothetical protein